MGYSPWDRKEADMAGPLGTPLGLAQRKGASPRGEAGTSGFPIFPSGCEGKLGVALESLQGRRDLT